MKTIQYKVDKNIPVPPRRCNAGQSKYPVHIMLKGDSFLVPTRKNKRNTNIQVLAAQWSKRLKPKKFVARLLNEGVRIWRIK